MSPGTYLAKRRHAAGLSIDDVAAAVSTDPRLGEVDRVELIRLIEADVAVITPDVMHALGQVICFSGPVLLTLIALRGHGHDTLEAPRLCIICGCSDHDACRTDDGLGCAWSGPDTCTRCAPNAEAA